MEFKGGSCGLIRKSCGHEYLTALFLFAFKFLSSCFLQECHFLHLELVHPDHDVQCTEESSVDMSSPSNSSEISGIYGNPDVNTRVGDEYQADIPPMILYSEHFIEKKGVKLKPNAASLDDGMYSKPVHLEAKMTGKCDMDQLPQVKSYSALPGSSNASWSDSELPGSSNVSWSDSEVDAFVLGLYIFGKNFDQIERFMDSKKMGDLLSFYYGRFFKSNQYQRWSACRKTKSKKYIHGYRIFTGWRHEELFSRLQPHVPEHFQNSFLEISMAITNGKFSLEDIVSQLKAAVGIQLLVEAVGIGKGKDDLTGLAVEPVKRNPLFSFPNGIDISSLTGSEIMKLLTGDFRWKDRYNEIFWDAVWPRLLERGWNSEQLKNQGFSDSKLCLVFLIPGITKFSRRKLVKGIHYFESVGEVVMKVVSEPRLLQSECEEARVGSCNEENQSDLRASSDLDAQSVQKSNYYLRPQVSEDDPNIVNITVADSSLFDGKKVVKVRKMRYKPDELKGTSFTTLSRSNERSFLDNLTDDDEPDAIELSSDSEKNVSHAACSEAKCDGTAPNNRKLTIVDTSLLNGAKSSSIRDLIYSPDESKVVYAISNSSNEGDTAEDLLVDNVSESSNGPPNGERNLDKCKHRKGISDYCGTKISDSTNKLVESLQDRCKMSNVCRSKRTVKNKSSRRVKFNNSIELVTLGKQQRITARPSAGISRAVKKCSIVQGPKQITICCALRSQRADWRSRVDHSQENQPSTESPAEDNKEKRLRGGILSANCQVMEASASKNAKHQPLFFTDKNPPLISLTSENGENERAEAENRLDISVDEEEAENRLDIIVEQEEAENRMDISVGQEEAENRLDISVEQEEAENRMDVSVELEDAENRQDINDHHTCFAPHSDDPDPEASNTSVDANHAPEPSGMTERRQSTRKRPMTSRALEAFECGFLNVKNREDINDHHACFAPHSDDPDPEASNTSVDANHAPEPSGMTERRQSTRKRPMTSRALEAFGCGFLDVKKQKRRIRSQETLASIPVKADHKAKITSSSSDEIAGTGIVDAEEERDAEAQSKKVLLAEILTKLKK
ncbi:hypothetical protein Tsubulata_025583 [Turnera subulata]|uniref:SANT domain-containing protein n=1 Tax=Turnera subulata TaxID=218843 RepID=A0A9Q0F3I6_9ROSI|nr:hypothetical protein Tsubulata_025583 [Turnera subulata]